MTSDSVLSSDVFAVLMNGTWSVVKRVSASSYGKDTGEDVWSEQDTTAWIGLVGKEDAAINLSRRSLDDGVDDIAAVLWRTELVDAGVPQSAIDGRTRDAFDEESESTKNKWRKYARAALARTRTTEMVVKALKWRGPFEAFPSTMWEAETSFGRYEIEEQNASDSPVYELRFNMRVIAIKDGVPEIQECAQADFDQRIRSALASPASVVQVTEAMWQDISTAPKDGGHRMMGLETGPELLLWDGEFVRLGFWNGRTWDDGDYHNDLGEMTHWMPLPSPPAAALTVSQEKE